MANQTRRMKEEKRKKKRIKKKKKDRPVKQKGPGTIHLPMESIMQGY